jgi:hypothetical protein
MLRLKPDALALLGLFFFMAIHSVYGQEIRGVIHNKPINVSARIITKSEKSSQIQEFKIINKDSFNLSLKKTYDTLTINCLVNGFKASPVNLISPDQGKIYEIEFILKRDSILKLEEVVLTAKKKFYKKKDTTGFIVSKYRDGTERKVKDLLKKLPQIEVNEITGTVKYKGKEIETITLDGDNLFGNNYTIATKNINIDIIKAVEAIDNYEENELLKGISEGGKVSLNLVLKDNKTDLSGATDLALGTLNETSLGRGLSTSLLAINKKHKSFIAFSNNNIGINNSPFSFENSVKTSEQRREDKFLAYSIFTPLTSNSNFGTERSNINNQNFGSVNSLIPVDKGFKIRFNGIYLRDNIRGANLSSQTLFSPDDNPPIAIFDNTTFTYRPISFRAELDIKYRINKRSLLSVVSKTQNLTYENRRETQSNNNEFLTGINSENFFTRTFVEYTYKLSDSVVFQSQINYSKNTRPESLSLESQIIEDEQFERNSQSSNFSKTYVSVDNRLIGKVGRWKYGSQLEFYSNKVDYNSTFVGTTNLIENSTNNLERINQGISNQTYGVLTYNQWRFSIKNKFQYLKQGLSGFSERNDFFVNPSIAIAYLLGENKNISLTASYNKKPLTLQNSFQNRVLTDNRTLVQNSPTLNLQENANVGLYFSSNNLYRQQTLSVGLQYTKTLGSYFQDITYDSNNIFIRNFFLSENSQNFSGNISGSKYISAISSNIKLNLSGNYNQYFNIINSSSLRDNVLIGFNSTVEINTSFDFPFNFGNEISFSRTENRFNNGNNIFETLNNNARLVFKSKNGIISSLSSNFYSPDLENSTNNIHFIDFKINYTPKAKNWNLTFLANNITDNFFYNSVQVSDFSTSTFQNQLLGRTFLIGLEFSF